MQYPWIQFLFTSELNNIDLMFAEDGKELLIDVDSKKKEEILSHCLRIIGKSK